MTKLLQKIGLLLICVVLVGCGAEADVTVSRNTYVSQEGLEVRLTLLDRFDQPSNLFAQGELMTFEISVINNSNDVAVVRFPREYRVEFYVDTAGGQLVATKDFDLGIDELSIPAYGSYVISEPWDVSDYLDIGRYVAYGSFLDSLDLNEVSFTID